MGIVTLVSGGLDSTLMAVLAREADLEQYPLFVDYGQRSVKKELAACRRSMRRYGLPEPRVAGLGGFGALVRSGLTDLRLHIMEDAFTPGRNLFFLLLGAAYAYTVGADSVAIGLLDERTALFPDQRTEFLSDAQELLTLCMGRRVNVLAPLNSFSKQDVVRLARAKGIDDTYSCHAGGDSPCGVCIACREFQFKED
jgi:7-cyano-7-deazaguanine synthase